MPRVTEGMFAEGTHTVDPREPLLSETRGAKDELDDLFSGMSNAPETQQQPIIQQQPMATQQPAFQQNLDQSSITDNKEDWAGVWEAEKRKQLDESRVVWAQQLWEEQRNDFENMYQTHQAIVTPKITETTDDKTKWEEAKQKGSEIAAKVQEAGSSAVDTVQQKGHEFKEATAERFEAAKEKTQELTEKAQEKGAEIKEKVQEKAADMKESVKEGFETAKEKGAIVGEQIKEKAVEAKDFTKEKLVDAQHKVEEWKDTAFEKGAEAKEGTAHVMANIATHVKDAALTVGHVVADTFSHVVEKLKPHDKEKDDQFSENNNAVVETGTVEAATSSEQPLLQAPEDPKFSTVKLDNTEDANLEFAEGSQLQGQVVAEAPIIQPRDKTKSRFC